MPRTASTAELIELAAEGALSSARFTEFLAETARAIEAPSGNVQAFDTGSGKCVFASLSGPNYTEKVLRLYQSEFRRIEPFQKFVTREHLGADTNVLLCHRFISDAEVARDRYFQDFLIPETGTRWLAGALSFDDPDHAIQYGFARLADQPHFEDEAGRLLESITPHLRRSVKVAIALAHSGDVAAALAEAFGRRWAAIYLLDDAGRVVWMNAAAEGAALAGSALTVRAGQLHALSPDAQARLDRAIRAAADLLDTGEHGDFDMPDQEGRRFPVSVRHIGPMGLAAGGPSQARIAVLAGGHAPRTMTAWRLARIYGLTAAEARLSLDLAEGLSIEACAARRDIRPHTVRTQLKSIFGKTATRRQGELVALVWRWAQM